MSTAPSPNSPFLGRQRPSSNSQFARPSSPILRLAETRAALRSEQFCQRSPPRGYPCTLMPTGVQAQPIKQPRGAVGMPSTFPVFPPSPPRGRLISAGPSTATATAQPLTTPSFAPGQLTGPRPSIAVKSQATRLSASTERRPRPSPIAVTEGSFRTSAPQITFCTVCAATETPEWRKGPAGIRSLCNGCGLLAAKRQRDRGVLYGPSGFSSVESILEELEQIGRERFKVKGGRYHLPSGVIQRVIDMVENPATPNTPLERGGTTRRPRSGVKRGSGDDVPVTGGIGGFARRASTSNASVPPPPAPQGLSSATMRATPTIRARRSGSLGSAHSGYQSNVGDATVHAFPPSSSYMNPLGGGGAKGGVGPVPAFRFGVQAPSQSCSTRSWLTATRPMSAPGAVARGEGAPAPPPPPFLLRPPSPSPSSSARPMSALAASADRMSIHHLTSSRMRARSPPRFEMPKRANEYHTSVPTSALRRGTATTFGPATALCARPAPAAVGDVASHARKPTT